MGKYGVYRIFNITGQLLYVGASRNFKLRMHSHAGSKPWRHEIDEPSTVVEWFDSTDEASFRECEIIRTESPKYNTRGKDGQPPSKYNPRPEYVSPMHGMTLDQMTTYLLELDSALDDQTRHRNDEPLTTTRNEADRS